MQDYQTLKQYWLDLLIKSNLHEKRVWVVPKDGKTKPHWRTVRVKDDDSQTDTRMKKQDDDKGRIKKQDENTNPRVKKQQDTPAPKNPKQDDNTQIQAPTKSSNQQGQRHWNTMKIPKAIKQAANDHLSKFGSRDEFLKDLKDKGITWNEHSHAGINHMRAMMALNAAIMNESHGFKNPFGDSSSTQSDSSQSAQDKPSTQQSTSKSKAPTGRVSKESKAKTHEFFMSCADREEFYTKLKQLGVKWTENDHPAINFMRAKMALSLKVENGFDPNSTNTKKQSSSKSDVAQSKIVSKDDSTNQLIKPNYDSRLCKQIGKDQYQGIIDILNSSTVDKSVAKMVAIRIEDIETDPKYWGETSLRIKQVDLSKPPHSCHYNRKLDEVHVDIPNISKGDSYRLAYEIFFHEMGHACDYGSGGEIGGSSIPDSAELSKAVHQDVDNLLKNAGVTSKMSDREARQKVMDYMGIKQYASSWGMSASMTATQTPQTTTADISDLIEGATMGRIRVGAGHGKEYWEEGIMKVFGEELNIGVSVEAFAEITSASLVNPKSLEMIKTYLPNTYSAYLEIVKTKS